MAFRDYADCFDYREKIILDLAQSLIEKVAKETIDTLKNMTAEMQSGEDSGLENLWEELCVQLQTEFSVLFDLYDELVENLVEEAINLLEQYALAAIQYSIDFQESDHGYEYNPRDIISEIKYRIYDIAREDKSENVSAYIGRVEPENN